MATSSATAVVRITADTQQLEAATRKAAGHLDEVGKHGGMMAAALSGAVGRLGSLVGGEVGEMINQVNEGLAQIQENAKGIGKGLQIGGAVAAGAGGLLTAMGSKDQAASQQLKQAVANAGQSYSDFSEEVENAIKGQEKFGTNAVETQNALQILVQGTGDTKKALDLMGEAANLAAAKHISLTDASSILAKVVNGGSTKALKEFGISVSALENPAKELDKANQNLTKAQQAYTTAVQKHGPHSKEAAAAAEHLKKAQDGLTHAQGAAARNAKELDSRMTDLASKVKGQAAAASDTFTGKLKAMQVTVEDNVAQFGQKFGPALGIVGTGMGIVGTAVDLFKARQVESAAATVAATAATDAQTASQIGLNAAFLANPVVLIIAGIVALVAVVVIAYNKVGWFRDLVNNSFKFISNVVANTVQWIKDHWQLLLAIMIGPVGLVILFVANNFGKITGFVKNVISDVKNVMSGVVSILTTPFKLAFNGIATLWNGTIGKLTITIPSWIPGIGGKSFSMPDIPMLADGGIVSRPTLALIGERGPEAVVPLGRGGGMIGSPNVMVIVDGRQVAAAVRPATIQETQRYRLRNGYSGY